MSMSLHLTKIFSGRVFGRAHLRNLAIFLTATSILISEGFAQTPAKQVFGRMAMPANTPAAAHGFYSKGCLSGGIAMPVDGPTWQVMRLSRNRRWGHPDLITLILNKR